MKAPVNKTKAIIAAATTLFFGGYGVYYIIDGSWLPAAIFLTIAVLFCVVLIRYGSMLDINSDRIRLSFLGIPRKEIGWQEIRELGLIGENVFRRSRELNEPQDSERTSRKIKTGDKYIYFSPVRMTPNERFDMIVKWPPKDKYYCEYSDKALEYCMTLWSGELQTYNVEDLFPNSGEPRVGGNK